MNRKVIVTDCELANVVGGSSRLDEIIVSPEVKKLLEMNDNTVLEPPRYGIKYPGPYRIYI